MSEMRCPLEASVEEGVRRGELTAELRSHAAVCPSCADLVLVGTMLLDHARELPDPQPLPDPGVIWWRAQLQSRCAAAERATRMIRILHAVAGACAAAAAIALLPGLWPALRSWLQDLATTASHSASAAGAASPGLVLGVSSVLLLLLWLADFRVKGLEE